MDAYDPSEDSDDPLDALRQLMRELGLPADADVNDAEVRVDLFRTMIQRLMPANDMTDEAVIWETARQTARRVVAGLGPDPSCNSRTSRQVSDAVHLAELWLSEATALPPVPMMPLAWSRAEWIESTLPSWKAMIEPVLGVLSNAVSLAIQSRMDLQAEGEIAQLQAILQPIMSRTICAMFGAHVGEGLGRAATATMTGTDLGLPLLERAQIGILPTNLSAVQQQAELEEEGLLLYCAIREAARQRLFSEIGWITPQIIALVQHYARETRVDPEAIANAVESVVPDHLSAETVVAFQTDFSAILFARDQSEEQDHILDRLATLLAEVEGWVDDVASSVAKQRLPGWEAIAESLRRHRATTQPVQGTVTPLIGLNASPQSIRQAAQFWQAIRLDQGIEARDEIWRHPEAMPEAQELLDPAAFMAKPADAEDALDEELRRFLDQPDQA